jgi:hypothetical protein
MIPFELNKSFGHARPIRHYVTKLTVGQLLSATIDPTFNPLIRFLLRQNDVAITGMDQRNGIANVHQILLKEMY